MAAADEEPPELRFTSWNLKNYLYVAGAAPADTSRGKPKPPGEVEAVVSVLGSLRPDILGVCEIGGEEELSDLQARLKAAGIDLPHSHHLQAADDYRHLAVLSRYPLAAVGSRRDLTYVLDATRFPVQRGILDVTVRVRDDWDLRLIGVHLKSRRDVPEADQELMRRNEAHLLRRHLDGVLADQPDANLLVYGDFNDTRDQPSIRAVRGIAGSPAALTELAAEDAAGTRWTYYFAPADEYSRIDYLFAGRGLMPELKARDCRIYDGGDWRAASDHRPVSAAIRLPVPKVPAGAGGRRAQLR